MSNNVKLQVLLRAVDQASRPFKSIRTASKSLSGDIRETQKSLRELNGHASRIEGFRKTSAQLAVTGHALEKARQEAEALATQFKNTERPTRAQAKVLESAKRAAEDLQAKYNRLTDSVKRQQRELAVVGINTRNLAHDEQGLKNRISETTAQLNRQRDALARVSAQQAKLNAVKQRYQAGKELAGNMASVGAAGVGIAAAGTMAGVKLLMPGYEFAQKNSELQAVLGVAKDSAEMAALRKQARQLGDNTAASADDAAGAQIIIAKAGGDAAAIQAATPVTLNMALANQRSMEENAQLLLGTKASFQLSNDDVSHVGDVLSATMNKSAADFQGLSDALTYLGPVARTAGVSLEQAAAMTGVLHDNNIRGSMAGTGSSAVVTRLQAPTGKAWDALKELGVKTSDKKGNMRPLFTILKEIQASFDKHKLGTSQKGEYLKTIFGEEALKSANVLLAAAASGKLDKLTATLKASDGKTEELVKIMQDIGKRDAFQFLGVGEENITLAGVLYPELTGGKLTMTTLRLMAEEGRAWPLLDGTGMIYGMYVISRVSETGSIFFADGTPRKIDFTLSLTRVDESLAALYGDIGKQAESLIGKAGSMATKFTGMTGAG